MTFKKRGDKTEGDGATEGRVQSAIFREIHDSVYELEKENCSKLILFRSKGNWWKLGGNSALIYREIVASEIGKNPKMHPDGDFGKRFHPGVVSIKDAERLARELERCGIKQVRTTIGSDRVRIFELRDPLNKEEMRLLRRKEELTRQELNEIVAPKMMIDGVRYPLTEAVKICFRAHTTNSPKEQYRVNRVVDIGIEIVAEFTALCRNKSGTIEELDEINFKIKKWMTEIEMMGELEVWRFELCVRINQFLEEAMRKIQRKVREMKDEAKKIGRKDKDTEDTLDTKTVEEIVREKAVVGEE